MFNVQIQNEGEYICDSKNGVGEMNQEYSFHFVSQLEVSLCMHV